MSAENDSKEKKGKQFNVVTFSSKLNGYVSKIFNPFIGIRASMESNVVKDIAFSSPYSIQMDTKFLIEKKDIDEIMKRSSENDKSELIKILEKNLEINSSTKYPVQVDYRDLVSLTASVMNSPKIDGSCFPSFLEIFSTKIDAKISERRTAATIVNYLSFALGLVSTALTVIGFFVASVPTFVGILGLVLMGFFTVLSTGTRALNMINRTRNQNNRKEYKTLEKEHEKAIESLNTKLDFIVKRAILLRNAAENRNKTPTQQNLEQPSKQWQQILSTDGKSTSVDAPKTKPNPQPPQPNSKPPQPNSQPPQPNQMGKGGMPMDIMSLLSGAGKGQGNNQQEVNELQGNGLSSLPPPPLGPNNQMFAPAPQQQQFQPQPQSQLSQSKPTEKGGASSDLEALFGEKKDLARLFDKKPQPIDNSNVKNALPTDLSMFKQD